MADEQTIDSAPQSNWVTALTVLSGPTEGEIVEIKSGSFTIGRARGNGLVLDNKAVSRRHAAIEHKENKYVLHDLNSRWGLKVNGVDAKEAELKYGDEIEIAGIRLGFNLSLKSKLTKKKPNFFKHFIIVLLVASACLFGTLLYFKHQTRANLNRPGPDVLSKIIFHYDRGIYLYNQMNVGENNNMDEVVKEMKIVIDLDPEGKTQFSRSARRIIDGFGK